jgi:hypothetical protein
MPLRGPKAKGAFCALLLALSLLGLPSCAPAATLTNYLGQPWLQYWLKVNVGDTVVWVNEQLLYLGTNFVESYGGEWRSPPMVNLGDSFSFTFTNAGFYAYRTGVSGTGGYKGLPGTITVNGWTDAPPAVTILTPLDGSVFRWGPQVVQASVTNTANIPQIQYFANTNLIGIGTVGTSPPYAVIWPTIPLGKNALVAKAIGPGGAVVASSPPVTITMVQYSPVWGLRRLPTGEILFFYDAFPSKAIMAVIVCDSARGTNCSGPDVINPGVFVDESVRGGQVPYRFYHMGFSR